MARALLLWLVAQKGSAREGVRTPFLALELPQNTPFGASSYGIGSMLCMTSRWCMSRMTCRPTSSLRIWTWAVLLYILAVSLKSQRLLRLKLGAAIQAWRVGPYTVRAARALARLGGNLEDMSDAELRRWERHVRDGHVPYDRRCRTCVRTAGTGKAHRRVLAPSAYSLSLDIAGPFRVTKAKLLPGPPFATHSFPPTFI